MARAPKRKSGVLSGRHAVPTSSVAGATTAGIAPPSAMSSGRRIHGGCSAPKTSASCSTRAGGRRRAAVANGVGRCVSSLAHAAATASAAARRRARRCSARQHDEVQQRRSRRLRTPRARQRARRLRRRSSSASASGASEQSPRVRQSGAALLGLTVDAAIAHCHAATPTAATAPTRRDGASTSASGRLTCATSAAVVFASPPTSFFAAVVATSSAPPSNGCFDPIAQSASRSVWRSGRTSVQMERRRSAARESMAILSGTRRTLLRPFTAQRSHRLVAG